MNQKLILFDIDGTLMYHVGTRPWEAQYREGMKVAYGIAKPYEYSSYNGAVERYMAWNIAQKHNISKEEFFAKFPEYVRAMLAHLNHWSEKGRVFEPIVDAVALVEKLRIQNTHVLGILTGNARSIADWKLAHAGIPNYFKIGLYGDEADDRIALAGMVFARAKSELGWTGLRSDVVIIGDTIYDIRCGKAIGASTIAVMTGMHADPSVLAAESPDLLVSSLADPSVLRFFDL